MLYVCISLLEIGVHARGEFMGRGGRFEHATVPKLDGRHEDRRPSSPRLSTGSEMLRKTATEVELEGASSRELEARRGASAGAG